MIGDGGVLGREVAADLRTWIGRQLHDNAHDPNLTGILRYVSVGLREASGRYEDELAGAKAQGLAILADAKEAYRAQSRNADLLRASYLSTLQVMARAVEARDAYTRGHAERVGAYADAIAHAMGLRDEVCEECRVGGLLHDIGKIGVPDAILWKPAVLEPRERLAMGTHPEIGAAIVGNVPFLQPVLPCVLCHHERWDGGGYPAKLKGEDIPLKGRICAVADAFDAMTSTRSYRTAQSVDYALTELRQGRETQFDPLCVEGFEAALNQGMIQETLATAS